MCDAAAATAAAAAAAARGQLSGHYLLDSICVVFSASQWPFLSISSFVAEEKSEVLDNH